ncbi:MAG: NAD(P)H-hydrate dehydratase, partial [Lachnospiraceae bacterium]|nr:NAD(P)H-hydrate dehydratase [Candidatus Equihabitans merdae]
AYVISADIPSGICADDGQVLGTSVEADETVTMQALKRGHLLYPGASYAGQVTVADIGIQPIGELISAYSMEESDLDLIPKRRDRSNKGSYGKLLVVAGSLNMSGASYLSAAAAMKMGCGMVKILTVEENREILQRMLPEAMLDTYQDVDTAVEGLRKNLKWADAVVMGPGLGQSEEAHALVTTMLKEGNLPLVLDADGLNCLDGDLGLLKAFDQPCLITPHPGEMSRLSGKSIREILSQMIKTATEISAETGVYCLLKDAGTVNACPEGLVFINESGNHGMATAGSGDVLSGIAGGLMCRGVEASYIGALAAYIHGMAGDRAAARIGCDGMMASDMLAEIAAILKEYFS